MGEWECPRCGYIHEGRRPPKRCPECGLSGDRFEYYEVEEDWSEDWEDDEEDFD